MGEQNKYHIDIAIAKNNCAIIPRIKEDRKTDLLYILGAGQHER